MSIGVAHLCALRVRAIRTASNGSANTQGLIRGKRCLTRLAEVDDRCRIAGRFEHARILPWLVNQRRRKLGSLVVTRAATVIGTVQR